MTQSTLKEYASHSFVPAVEIPPTQGRRELDEAVERVRGAAGDFLSLSLDGRIGLIESIQRGTIQAAERAVAVSCRAKGIDPGTPLEGEEWSTGPANTMRHLRLLKESLQSLKRTGRIPFGSLRTGPDGRVTAGIFPGNAIDRLFLRDTTVDVLMEEGVGEVDVAERQASFYRHPSHEGRVVLVLGGGNIASLATMDVLTKLFNEGKVCVLKMNPVNAYLGPFIETAFAEVIERRFLAVVYGGSDEGAYLCGHENIDEIHLTGSDKTHDRIVWGSSGPEREVRRAEHTPLIARPLTCELGNVSPVIIVPGPYRDGELRYQARDLVGSATLNASFLCNAAKVLITPCRWKGRVPFIRYIEDALAHLPTRRAYYPGAVERWHTLTHGRHRLRTFGAGGEGRLPWALITWMDPEKRDDPLFSEESFCPIVAETSVGSPDAVEFLEKAVDFVNERLWGTLSATVIVHPRTLGDPGTGPAVESALSRLRYGTVAVNTYPGIAYGLASPPWGAFPGSPPEDIQSGSGWTHNTLMLEGVEKVILRHPLMNFPKPAYFPGHRSLRPLMKKVTRLEERYRWSRMPGVVMSALQG